MIFMQTSIMMSTNIVTMSNVMSTTANKYKQAL